MSPCRVDVMAVFDPDPYFDQSKDLCSRSFQRNSQQDCGYTKYSRFNLNKTFIEGSCCEKAMSVN